MLLCQVMNVIRLVVLITHFEQSVVGCAEPTDQADTREGDDAVPACKPSGQVRRTRPTFRSPLEQVRLGETQHSQLGARSLDRRRPTFPFRPRKTWPIRDPQGLAATGHFHVKLLTGRPFLAFIGNRPK